MEHYLVTLSAGYEWLTFPQNASYLEYPKCLYKLAKQNSAKLRITVSVTLFQHMDDIVPILSEVKTVVVLVAAFSAQAPQHKDRSAKHLPLPYHPQCRRHPRHVDHVYICVPRIATAASLPTKQSSFFRMMLHK